MSVEGYSIRLYVGPVGIAEYAAKLRDAGFIVDVEGTEHIHYRAPYVDGWGAISACDAVADRVGIRWFGDQRNNTVINTYP